MYVCAIYFINIFEHMDHCVVSILTENQLSVLRVRKKKLIYVTLRNAITSSTHFLPRLQWLPFVRSALPW